MTDKNENARQQAMAQMASIREMVAALECDYERLEELKDERAELEEASNDAAKEYDENQDPAQVDDLKAALLKAEEDLLDWIEENGEELQELLDAAGDSEDADDARQRIEEDALSVEVRGDWHTPGDSDGGAATEFKILLCTGGPAVQIKGDLDEYNQPSRAYLQCQDWFTAWEDVILDSSDYAALLTYAQVFYFGD